MPPYLWGHRDRVASGVNDVILIGCGQPRLQQLPHKTALSQNVPNVSPGHLSQVSAAAGTIVGDVATNPLWIWGPLISNVNV